MGGNSGGIIIQKSAVDGLTNPVVHGQLPKHHCDKVDPILAKDPGTWSASDKAEVSKVFSWALVNLE